MSMDFNEVVPELQAQIKALERRVKKLEDAAAPAPPKASSGKK